MKIAVASFFVGALLTVGACSSRPPVADANKRAGVIEADAEDESGDDVPLTGPCSGRPCQEFAGQTQGVCPPTGPTGTDVGAVLKDGSLPLVSGGKFQLSEHCTDAIYVLGVTETCSICMRNLKEWSKPGGLFDELTDEGVIVVLVSETTASGNVSGPIGATSLMSNYRLERFVVAYDPAGSSFNSFIGQRTRASGERIAMVIRPGNVLGAFGQLDKEADIRKGLGNR